MISIKFGIHTSHNCATLIVCSDFAVSLRLTANAYTATADKPFGTCNALEVCIISVIRTAFSLGAAIPFIHKGINTVAIASRQIPTVRDASLCTAHLALVTDMPAFPTIRPRRFEIGTYAVAFRQPLLANRLTCPLTTDFASSANMTTFATVFVIQVGDDAFAVAFRLAARAIDVASAFRAKLTRLTNMAAGAAVADIRCRVNACTAAFLLPFRTHTLAVHADHAGAEPRHVALKIKLRPDVADFPAFATVIGIRLHVHTDIAASLPARVAQHDAFPGHTAPPSLAYIPAYATVAVVRTSVHTNTAARNHAIRATITAGFRTFTFQITDLPDFARHPAAHRQRLTCGRLRIAHLPVRTIQLRAGPKLLPRIIGAARERRRKENSHPDCQRAAAITH